MLRKGLNSLPLVNYIIPVLLLALGIEFVGQSGLLPLEMWLGIARRANSLSLWQYLFVAVPLGVLSALLIDRLQMLQRYYASLALLISVLLLYLLAPAYEGLALLGYALSLLGLAIYLDTAQMDYSPDKHLTVGAIIGFVALWEPRILYLIPLALLSLAVMESLSLRNFMATLMGALSPLTIALPIVHWLGGESVFLIAQRWRTPLGSLSVDWLSQPELLRLSIPLGLLLLLAILGLCAFVFVKHNESIDEHRRAKLYSLWIFYLSLLGVLTWADTPLFLLMAALPTSLSIGRALSFTSGKGFRFCLILLFVILLIPLLLNPITY